MFPGTLPLPIDPMRCAQGDWCCNHVCAHTGIMLHWTATCSLDLQKSQGLWTMQPCMAPRFHRESGPAGGFAAGGWACTGSTGQVGLGHRAHLGQPECRGRQAAGKGCTPVPDSAAKARSRAPAAHTGHHSAPPQQRVRPAGCGCATPAAGPRQGVM